MSKLVNFGILFITMSALHASCNDDDDVDVVPVQSTKELLDCIRDNVLKRSNVYRLRHKLEELRFNEKMNNEAQEWAVYMATNEKFEHKPTSYGVNITMIQTIPNVGARVVDLWHSLIGLVLKSDDEEKLRKKTNTGVLTQLLWKSSTEIGVGVAETKDLGYFAVVVYYKPKGNIENLFSENLPKFEQTDINRGTYELYFFDFTSTLISNSERGVYKNTVLPLTLLSVLPEKFHSNRRHEGLVPMQAARIRNQVFKKLNVYRKYHGISDLDISADLNDTAQEIANAIALKIPMQETNNEKRRGIISEMSPPVFGDVGEVAVDSWYQQIKYTHENMEEKDFYDNKAITVLVQILWKASKQVGVGVAINEDGFYFIVAFIDPRGHIHDSCLENLPKFVQKDIDQAAIAMERLNKLMRLNTNEMDRYKSIVIEEDSDKGVPLLEN